MWIIWSLLALLLPIAAGNDFQEVEDCKAAKYGLPGFRSERGLFPNADPVWDGMTKVGFQNAEATWIAGNFRDTGSDFVAVLFGGSIQHKEYWPAPPLMRTLAINHGISSVAVDISGRGESCGSEALFNYTAALTDMTAAVHFINSLPGRYCGALFGMSSAASSALFYAARVGDVPAVFMAEPDDITVLSEFIDTAAGGEIAHRLARAPEVEIIMPMTGDHATVNRESLKELFAINLQAEVNNIPSDVHLYWYTADRGSSLQSQMKNLTFAHISGFHHRHFPEAQHDFLKQHPNDFLGQTASDMQSEAFDQAAAREYMSRHKQPLRYAPSLPPPAEAKHERLTIQEQRQQKRQRQRAMPRHFFINSNYTTSLDQGLVNPAAVELQPFGWILIVMHYKGCFGSNCTLQTERAFTPPLLANMGRGDEPEIRNITNPRSTSFNSQSWAAVTEEVSAHPVGGLRFSSFRPFVYQSQLHVSYAMEIFDKSLTVTPKTRSDAHKMRFQGNGFARVDLETLELHSLVNFAQPLIPRREFPCCDKNWGVWEDNHELYILYTVMPCLTIFKLDFTQKTGASLVFASCLTDDVGRWVSKSVNLEMRDIRISGHPILWSEYPQTLLVLVHHNWRNHGGSKHWAVQMHFEPKRRRFVIAAISKEPVLDHEHYYLYNEAVQNVIAVGSYHLAKGHLRILYGDGDKYSAVADVDLASVSWVQLNRTSASEWLDGLNVALGDRVNSITYTEYESLIWK
ncbi:hypothetical protein WJX77_010215 [Trebouxia sp. C0004]